MKSYLKLLKVINRNIGEGEFGGEMMEQFGGRCPVVESTGAVHTTWEIYIPR